MPVRFIWDESYSVGHAELDAQHRRIFEVANSLPETLDEAARRRTVAMLYLHAHRHFEAEERVMREAGFPGLEEHCRLHQEMIAQLDQVNSQTLVTDDSAVRVKQIVYNWLTAHVLTADMAYARFLRDQQKKAA